MEKEKYDLNLTQDEFIAVGRMTYHIYNIFRAIPEIPAERFEDISKIQNQLINQAPEEWLSDKMKEAKKEFNEKFEEDLEKINMLETNPTIRDVYKLFIAIFVAILRITLKVVTLWNLVMPDFLCFLHNAQLKNVGQAWIILTVIDICFFDIITDYKEYKKRWDQ